MTKITRPYSRINSNVKAILDSDALSRQVIEAWIEDKSANYFKNSHNSFSNLDGKYFVSLRNVKLWTGDDGRNIYQKLYRYYSLFEEYGVVCLDEGWTTRLEAATLLGLDAYVQMTGSLYLFSPRAVVLFLLSASTDKADSFREYIKDWATDKPYCLPKLFVTLQEKVNV